MDSIVSYRHKRPVFIEQHRHNVLWREGDSPLLRRADNVSTYSTQAPLGIIHYAEMRTKQKEARAPIPSWNA